MVTMYNKPRLASPACASTPVDEPTCNSLRRHANQRQMGETDKMKSTEALAIICATEDFGTHPDRYVESANTKRSLVQLKVPTSCILLS